MRSSSERQGSRRWHCALPASATILTPATSLTWDRAFDSLGWHYNSTIAFEVEEGGDDPFASTNCSQGKFRRDSVYRPDNLFSGLLLCSSSGIMFPLPAVRIRMTINIPPGCGLGSSATAVVGGLVAASEWLRWQDWISPEMKLLGLAVEVEAGNHPDNVAPALLGGLVATTQTLSDGCQLRPQRPALASSISGDIQSLPAQPFACRYQPSYNGGGNCCPGHNQEGY